MKFRIGQYLVLFPMVLISAKIWIEILQVEECYYGVPNEGIPFLFFSFLLVSVLVLTYLIYSIIIYRTGVVPTVLFFAVFGSAFYADGFDNLGEINNEYIDYGLMELEDPKIKLQFRENNYYTLRIMDGGDGCRYSGYYKMDADTLDLGPAIVEKTNGKVYQKYFLENRVCKAYDNPSDSTLWLLSVPPHK